MRRAATALRDARRLEWRGRAPRLTDIDRSDRARQLTTQIDIFESDQDWTVPALLVVLMTVLAMLGIVANVAAA